MPRSLVPFAPANQPRMTIPVTVDDSSILRNKGNHSRRNHSTSVLEMAHRLYKVFEASLPDMRCPLRPSPNGLSLSSPFNEDCLREMFHGNVFEPVLPKPLFHFTGAVAAAV